MDWRTERLMDNELKQIDEDYENGLLSDDEYKQAVNDTLDQLDNDYDEDW